MEICNDDDGYSSFLFDDHSDFCTGYLQDVLFEFTSKRRRTSTMNSWTSDCNDTTLTHHSNMEDVKTGEEAMCNSEVYDSSSSSHKDQWTPEKQNFYCIDPIFTSGCDEKRKKRMVAKVVYPFAVVKPGGFEGDVTLNDINQRILMPPTRPVRHPVGDFACRSMISPDGPGLSGKAVVAFTRIHTQGRGTITIIRTRG